MKTIQKLAALLLALLLACALAVPALATDAGDNTEDSSGTTGDAGESQTPTATGSITIDNAVAGETYTAYKLFDVSYNTDKSAYSYYLTSGQESLKTALEGLGLSFTTSADGSRYNVNQTKDTSSDTVFVKSYNNDGTVKETITAATLAASINSALNADNSTLESLLTPAGTSTAQKGNSGSVTASINNLSAGYYFVDSSLGSLCALDTADDTVTIYEKNTQPSIAKKVLEDSNNTYQDYATIDVIDTVYYQLTVNTGTNEKGSGTGVDGDYTITDTLPNGITYNASTQTGGVKVTTNTGTNGTENGTKEEWTKDTDYTVSYDSTNRKLTITLKSSKLATLAQNTDITITYNAAVTASDVTVGGNGNKNTATLTYKQQSSTDTAVVYTYEIGITKTNSSSDYLAGVKFILSKTEGTDPNATTKYATVDNNGYLTDWKSNKEEATQLTTDNNGKINVKGLDVGTYILTETETLPGYNLLNDTITVTINGTSNNNTAGINNDANNNTNTNTNVTYKLTNSEEEARTSITVVNNTGSELPSTGGMGTTLFYIIGGILVVVAGVLLVTKKRMDDGE